MLRPGFMSIRTSWQRTSMPITRPRVPVGDDQRQHLELANDIAQKFNHDYGVDFFPNIEPVVLGPAARVMSLRDGTKKMSKSDPSDQSRINLNDDADTIALKIRRAKTDPMPLPSEVEGLADRPEARNLVGIYAALTDTDHASVLREHGGQGFGPFKTALTELLVEKLAPIASATSRLLRRAGRPARSTSVRRGTGGRHRGTHRQRGRAPGRVRRSSPKLTEGVSQAWHLRQIAVRDRSVLGRRVRSGTPPTRAVT